MVEELLSLTIPGVKPSHPNHRFASSSPIGLVLGYLSLPSDGGGEVCYEKKGLITWCLDINIPGLGTLGEASASSARVEGSEEEIDHRYLDEDFDDQSGSAGSENEQLHVAGCDQRVQNEKEQLDPVQGEQEGLLEGLMGGLAGPGNCRPS